MSARMHMRKFDWAEAQRRRASGETYTAIAASLGVTPTAIYFACDAKARQRAIEVTAEWHRQGVCPDCGAQSTRVAGGRSLRCVGCAAKARANITDTSAYCPACKTWKPLDAFTKLPHLARIVRHECRACDTARRRAYRARQKDAGFSGRGHGMVATYSDGCRCVDCRKANMEYRRSLRAKDVAS